jgi:hypothetical protein
MNKGKTPGKGTKEEKKESTKVQTKKSRSKVQNTQWGALREENTKPRTYTHHQ